MKQHNSNPIPGYGEGFIVSDEKPVREWTDRGDQPKGNRANPNDWFYIGTKRYNVHPYVTECYDADDNVVRVNGYPVRWVEDAPAKLKIVIKLNDIDEFEVPAPTTDELYFTDDLEDAKGTARMIHGKDDIEFVVRRGTYQDV